mgnify:CR=1 FL=1
MPGVVGVAHAEWFGAKYQNESNAFPVFAVEPGRYLDMYPEFTVAPARARGLRQDPHRRRARAAGWSSASAGRSGQKLPISLRDPSQAPTATMNWEFDLVGVIDAEDPAVKR